MIVLPPFCNCNRCFGSKLNIFLPLLQLQHFLRSHMMNHCMRNLFMLLLTVSWQLNHLLKALCPIFDSFIHMCRLMEWIGYWNYRCNVEILCWKYSGYLNITINSVNAGHTTNRSKLCIDYTSLLLDNKTFSNKILPS